MGISKSNGINPDDDPESYFFEGDKQDDLGNLEEAYQLFLQGAKLGSSDCQSRLALCYDLGYGVGKNIPLAMYWYKRNIRLFKNDSSCHNLALLFAAQNNHRRAVFWWEKAIRLGGEDAALYYAKYIFRRNKCRYKKKIFYLLNLAKNTQYISEYDLELTTRFLRKLEQ